MLVWIYGAFLSAIAVFLITLGLGQLISTVQGWQGLSLTGQRRWVGYLLGGGLVIVGAGLLPSSMWVLLWTIPAGPAALVTLLWGGSNLAPPPDPDRIFHGPNARAVQIPDGDESIPGLILTPADPLPGVGVCLVHGAADTRISFKWLLVESLLDAGVTVLSIDMPGHGENQHRPLAYPDSLSTIPAALDYMRHEIDITNLGILGISLGGAMTLKALTTSPRPIEALVLHAVPVAVQLDKKLFYGEIWRTMRSPLLPLFRIASPRQLKRTWDRGGYRSTHSIGDLFGMLNPPASLSQLPVVPTLLIYGGRDAVAPRSHREAMQNAAPHADLIYEPHASHVALILMRRVTRKTAQWLRAQLAHSKVIK